MKNKVIHTFLAILLSFTVGAQNYKFASGESSFELSIGPSTLFIGDIGSPLKEKYFFDTSSTMHDSLKLINSSIVFGFHQELDDKFAYKISVHTSSYERQKSTESVNYFLSNVFELTARGEYTLFRKIKPHESHFFIHAGIGVLYSSYVVNPQPSVALEPLWITAPIVPVGVGYRYYLTDRFKLGADFNIHYVFNDMVEGRGVPTYTTGTWPQDVLMNASITASYVIFEGNKRRGRCRCEWY